MANGDITLLNTLEFETDWCSGGPKIIHIAGNVYLIATSFDPLLLAGVLKTVTIYPNGDVGTVIDTLVYDAVRGHQASLAHIPGTDKYIVAYRGPGNDGWMKTFSLADNGYFGSLIDDWEFDPANAGDSILYHLGGTVWLIVYRGAAENNGQLKTFNVNANGTFGDPIASQLYDSVGFRPSLAHIAGDVFAIACTGLGNDGHIYTWTIESDGTIAAVRIDFLNFDTTFGYDPYLLHIAGDVYVIGYRKTAADGSGTLITLPIADDGTLGDIGSIIDSYDYSADAGITDILHVAGEIYAFPFVDSVADGRLATVTIHDSGQIEEPLLSEVVYDGDVVLPGIIEIAHGIFAVVYVETANDHGILKTFSVAYAAPPTVTTQECTDIDDDSGTGHGNITDIGDAAVTQHGHCWSESHYPTIGDNKTENGAAGVGAFTSAITSLDPSTLYYVRAYATNEHGTAYGAEVELTTFAAKAPTVTTQECINVMPETATGQGTIVDKGYEPEQQLESSVGGYLFGGAPYVGQKLTIPNREVTGLSFLIYKTGSPTGDVTFQIRKVSDDSVILSKLWGEAADLPLDDPQWKSVIFDTPVTINEEVRLLAYHAGGTLTNCVLVRYQGTDVKADEQLTRGDIGDWDVDPLIANYDCAYKYDYTDTDYDITQHGHVWAATPNPTTAGSKTTLGAGEIGHFESSITGLIGGQTYYVRAYATNQYGTGYGDNVLLVTPTSDIPTVTTQACSAVTPESATGHGNIINFGDATPSQHGHCWSSTNQYPTLANSKNQNGIPGGTGAFTSAIIGLVPDVRYYIRAYATNEYGTGYGNIVTIFTYPGGVIINPENPVGIDWADDGLYTDISTDVLEEYIEWGKDRELNEAVPSLLALTVDNFNHKYSPPNMASPYNRDGKSVRAGHKVRVAFGYPYDNFDDINGITIENHVVPKDSQFTWSKISGTFSILSNKLRETGGSGGIAVLDFGEPDAHIQVTFTKGANNDCIIVFRYSNATNYLYVRATGTHLEVRKVVAGVDTQVDIEALVWANATTKTIKVILHGQYIYVVVDNTLLIKTEHTHNQTATKHGVGGPSIGTNARYEDFGGIYSLFYGTIDRIIPYPNREKQTALIEASGDLKILARHILYRRAYSYTAYPGGMRAFIQEVYKNTANVSQLGEIMDLGETIDASPYKSWWGISGLQICQNVEREENGFFYQDQASFWRFEAKAHRTTAPHNASRCTFYQDYETNKLAFTGLKWASGEDDVLNMISVHVEKSLSDPLNLATGGQYVWRCAEADVLDGGVALSLLEIPATSSVVIYFESKDFDCLEDLITPAQASGVYKIEGKITGGPFLLGEVVTGSVSGHTSNVLETSGGYIVLGDCTGAFDAADIWVGATSGATIAISFKIEGTITNGPFLFGEGITTDVSGDTGIVREVGKDFVLLESCSGVFNAGDTVLGTKSAASLNGTVTITVVGAKTAIPDYKANAAGNGTGDDKTGNLTVALAYPVYNSYGKGGKLTLTNDDTSPIYVTRLLVRGDGFKLQDKGSVYVEDATSKTKYGEHSYDVKAEILTSLAEAKVLVDDVKSKEIAPRSKVEIMLVNANKEMLTKILSLKVSDRITVNYSDMGIDEPFFINKIMYNITEGGLKVEAVVKLEEVS